MGRYQIIANCTNGVQGWWEETNLFYEKLESAKIYCEEHKTYTGDFSCPYVTNGIYDKEKDVSYYFSGGKWRKEYGWMFEF